MSEDGRTDKDKASIYSEKWDKNFKMCSRNHWFINF